MANGIADSRGCSDTTAAAGTASAGRAVVKGVAGQSACDCSGPPSQTQIFVNSYLGVPPSVQAPAQINLAKFDPDLGELKQVEYQVEVNLPTAFSQFENVNRNAACVLNAVTFMLVFSLRDPLGAEMFPTGAPFDCSHPALNIALSAYDQPPGSPPDFAGTSATTQTCSPPIPPSQHSSLTTFCSDQRQLNTFIGPGQVSFLVRSIVSQGESTNCVNLDANFVAEVKVTVAVRYTFCPQAGPPVCPSDVSLDLWPPNHQYVALDLAQAAGVTDPASLPLSFQITGITQDEPIDAQGGGDGNTLCDGAGLGTAVARIRAERQGGGDGRVYEVHYTVTNTAGLSCLGSFSVRVPHSQNGQPAVDSGQSFASNEGCP